MRCDLHVHTRHSGMCGVPLFNRICRESYNDPQDVYETLKQRGMDLVTVTDHDSIDAVESLRRYPDFFLSEEVTCTTPSGTEIHVGVYGIDERHHSELQRRKGDVIALMSYLEEQRLFCSINHVFSSLTGRRTHMDFALFEQCFAGIETTNGHMPSSSNDYAARLARRWRKAAVGGSDSHTLAALGLTYTDVSSATSIPSYLEALKYGHGMVHGNSGTYFKLTGAVFEIAMCMIAEKRWPTMLAPLLLTIPIVTLASYFKEITFAGKWGRRVVDSTETGLPATEVNASDELLQC